MRPPRGNEIDTRDPLRIAVWAEACSRHRAEQARHTPCPVSDRQEGYACAYLDVARLLVGLAEGATLKEIRHEIYALGHERGIVPWEDPEVAEREPAPESWHDRALDASDRRARPRIAALDPAEPAVPETSDEFEAERVSGEETP